MTNPRSPEEVQLPLDVYVPRLDGEQGAPSPTLLPVPYGAGIIGIPEGDELAIYHQARAEHAHTWADQLHMAAERFLGGEPPALRVSVHVMTHVGGYDPRDGTVEIDESWYARGLARSWLGSRRRHITEEVYTTIFPEHPARRVVLSSVRDGKVPDSVKAFAERNGHDVLIDPVVAAARATEESAPVAPAEDGPRTTILGPEETERFLAGLPGAKRNVEHVEVRSDGEHLTHYRLRYGNGTIGPWRHIVASTAEDEEVRDAELPRPDEELGFKPRRKTEATTRTNFRRVSSLRGR